MADVLKMRSFAFDAPREGECDILIMAGEHSGDEQASRMLKKAFAKNPNLKVCAFGGQALKEAGAQLLFDFTGFSVVGLFEVIKNVSFFKALSRDIVAWISKYKPKTICFVDYPGFNLHIADVLYKQGLSVKGGGDIKLLYYISPQIWAWKAKRRFKMARLLDSLAVIFPFETKCYADTSLPTHFVGHPFLEDEYVSPVEYSADGEILLLAGSRSIAVSRMFPIMLKTLRLLKGERAVALYPSQSIKDILEKNLKKFPDLRERVRIVDRTAMPLKAKAMMTSSGTMSLSCSLVGIPGAIVYKANPFTYILGRMLVNIDYLSIANILLDKPAWREFIQFDANPEKLAEYMRACLKPQAREEFLQYAQQLKNLLVAKAENTSADWLLKA